MNLTSNPTWNSFTSVVTIFTGIAGIIFGIYSIATHNKASLYADIYPVPFSIPLKEFQNYSPEDILNFLKKNKGQNKLNKQSKIPDYPFLKSDLRDYLDNLYRREKVIEENLLRADGMVVMTITNEGSLPAKKVRIFVDSATIFAELKGLKRSRLFSELEIVESDKKGIIMIPEIPQNTSITMLAWTDLDLSDFSRNIIEKYFSLSYSDGVGELNIHLSVSPFFEFLDQNSSIIFFLFLVGLIAILSITEKKSKEQKTTSNTNTTKPDVNSTDESS